MRADRQPARSRRRSTPSSALNSDIAFQGRYAFAGNYNGFVIYDITTPEQPEVVVAGALPGLAERHLRPRRTCSSSPPTPRAATTPAPAPAQPATDEGVLGGHQDLRHQRQGQPALHQVGRDRLRLAHPHAGPGQGPAGPSTSTSRRTAPSRRSPTASRRTTRSRIVKVPLQKPTDARGGRHAEPLPGRRLPGQPRRLGDHRLPRHHRLPGEGPGRRRLHG